MIEQIQTRISPLTDIVDKTDFLELFLEMPGVNKKNIVVKLNNNKLSVEGIIDSNFDQTKKYFRSFILTNEYQKPEKIDAKIEDGLLKIKLFKNKDQLPKQIQVN